MNWFDIFSAAGVLFLRVFSCTEASASLFKFKETDRKLSRSCNVVQESEVAHQCATIPGSPVVVMGGGERSP
ncbi:hypothetical protein CW304_02470 [Bacillus sp. UFRGS-B20]|nr:hypothetical protein CW304_02470 [Bacillus sp. UFRGS-B20]